MKRKYWILIGLAVFLLAFLLRFFPLRMAHWWDETVYLQHAEIIFSGRTNFSELAFRPPLLSMLFSFGFLIWHSVITASILTCLLTILVPISIFLIGQKIYSFKIGLIAGLLAAFLPFLIRNSNYLLTDVPVIAFMGFSFYFSLFRGKKSLIFLSGILCGLAVLMKFTAILFFPVLLLYLFLKKESWRNIFLFLFGGIVVLFPYFIWCYIKFGHPLNPFLVGPTMVTDKNEPTFFYFYQFHEAFSYFVVIGLSLWILHLGFKLKRKSYFSLKEDFIFLFWVFVFLVYLTKTPHKELRYILPITIPVILLASKGWMFIIYSFKKYQKFFWIFFIIYLIFLTQPRIGYIQETGLIDETVTDEMKIAEYLDEIDYNGIIYTNQRWPVFAYYTNLEVKLVYPYSEYIYDLIPEKMQDPGIWIGMYDAENYAPFKHPRSEWLTKDERFFHLRDIGNFYIYEYFP